MGLEFTGINDQHGAGIYMIHDGTVTQSRTIEQLAKELGERQKDLQIIVLSARDRRAHEIQDFYDLSSMGFPHILVIADDDRILQSWSGPHVPTLDHLAHIASSYR
jgi:hypothetical protein